ncbi:O-antigen ligase family protein [Plantactinospora sp. GCM10030261]|uniref:O-antigen ligase family protein n=1 Tax=Plantactinospora sp. GCM10030261 TaxID=3273420 RepID=UPI00361B16A3
MFTGAAHDHPQGDRRHTSATRISGGQEPTRTPVASAREAGATGPGRVGRLQALRSASRLSRGGRTLAAGLRSDPDQRVVAALALLVATLGLMPVALVPADSAIYAGVATGTPTLYTYTVAIAVVLVVVAMRTPRRLGRSLFLWVPFLIWMAVFAVLSWDASPRTVSGLLHLSLAAVVFAIGAAAERADRRHSILLWAFAAVAWIQLLASIAAIAGFPLRRISGQQALDVLGRATGLTSHPGELAKLLFFCGLCALTLPQRAVRDRWVAWTTLGAVLVGVSLTQSRTVLAAVVSMVVILVLLEFVTGRWQKRYFIVLGLTALLALVSLPWLIERFTADPGGGSRQHLLGVAWTVIRDNPWTGVGPNSYVAVVGTIDPLTASGVPVHNAFLLSAAELGILGAVLLWLPFARTATVAVRAVFRTRTPELAPRVLVSALPGLVLIGMTGWGLMQGPYFLTLALVTGYFLARTRSGGVASGDGRD